MTRVAVALRGNATWFFSYLQHLGGPLSACGVVLVSPDEPHDLLFIDDTALVERFGTPESIDRPLAVFERKDAAVVQPKLRRWLAHPQVKLWLKTTVFRDPADNNRSTASGHLHVDWIRRAEGDETVETRTPPRIEPADLAKIRAFQPVFMMETLDEARIATLTMPRRPLLRDRPIDLICAGRSDHGWDDVTRHRSRANVAAATLAGRSTLVGRGRIFSPQDFFRILGDCRILLSPLGHGEMNWKDWEAVMNETVIIKPSAAHVTTAMYDIYAKGGATVECAYDFSDLDALVDQVIDNLDEHQDRVARERRALVACFDPHRLAEHFAGMVSDALEASVAGEECRTRRTSGAALR